MFILLSMHILLSKIHIMPHYIYPYTLKYLKYIFDTHRFATHLTKFAANGT